MSGHLIDTNVLSELRKGRRGDPGVLAWFDGVDGGTLRLSAMVLGEIRHEVERIRPRDPDRAATLKKWLDRVVGDYSDRILPVDREVAEEWGRLSATRTLPTVDGLLAATARVHDLTLVTRNARDVCDLGVRWLDPFAP